MKIAFVGLGRMGAGMTHRLCDGGHEVHGFDPNEAARTELASRGGHPAASLEQLVTNLGEGPRAVWMMVPAGEITQKTVDGLAPLLAAGDLVIDGGNSNYRDDQRRSEELAKSGIEFMDVGTSGGVWGYEIGYCMMVGGSQRAVDLVAPALTTLAPPDGWMHTGAVGAGHFVKMVHNGIEYGLMQSYAEGFEILHASEFSLDEAAIAELWGRGSVVRSWLLELLAKAFREDPGLAGIKGYVEDSGEGRWTIEAALDTAVPAPVIALSLMMRQRSRQEDSYSAKVNAALRNQFGGHPVQPA